MNGLGSALISTSARFKYGGAPIATPGGGGFTDVPGPAGALALALSWALPTLNADGSAISPAVSNQRIQYDTVSRSPVGTYAYVKYIGNGTSTSVSIPSLAAGTYYATHQTYNGLGWSDASPEFSKASA